MSTPAELYRNAIDLNRYSNSVAKRIIVSYNDLLVDTAQRLAGLDAVSAPAKAARLRATLGQLKTSLNAWASNSTALSVRELEELAGVQFSLHNGRTSSCRRCLILSAVQGPR